MRFLEYFLWIEIIKVWIYVVYVIAVLVLEKIIRIILYTSSFFIPISVLDWCRHAIASSVPRFLRGFRDPLDPPEINYDSDQLIIKRSYPYEEHYVESQDGFRLVLHRIPRGKGNKVFNSNSQNGSRPVVFIMHGMMQSSESFIAMDKNLPFSLADAGFDVWLGNCRGNKYSCKHSKYTPQQNEYWNYSMDEVAKYDLPAMINYILSQTNSDQLSYVGFSQGTAFAFAAFSTNHDLARKINMFIALAPATTATGFRNQLLDSLAKISPDTIYFLFGRKIILGIVIFWQNFLSTRIFNLCIDYSTKFLFGWDMANIASEDKAVLYSHIYSYSSVKSVVHWFQIMRSNRFQMYDDHRWIIRDDIVMNYHGSRIPTYPLTQIECPISVFYGGRDALPDTAWLLKNLPKSTLVFEEPSYEHLDFMYARNAQERVYPKIIDLLQKAQKGTDNRRDGDDEKENENPRKNQKKKS